ncbi:MAG: OsmC family protein [Chloroflexi bacterium]|nr:OsmC family protein [Chloroflexota bacterium]
MTKATVNIGTELTATLTLGDHTLLADEPVDNGGLDQGPTPTEIMLSSLGACTAITLQLYARRKGWPLEGVEINLSHERFKAVDYEAYEGDSDFVNEFRQRLTFKGPLTPEQHERLMYIAGRCPVHRIISEPAFMFEELANEIVANEDEPVSE